MITFRDVSKRWGDGTIAIDRLSLEIPTGRITVLLGPSGCGKTTTLRMVNRLVEPTSGTIELDGRDIATLPVRDLRRGIGYVIQQVGLFPNRTIAENVATVPRLLGWDRVRRRARSLPASAFRRPAAARRRGPRARGRPAGAPHGRAVRGRGSRAARSAAA
jgi:osmoprotectant transport system ATP-binding protein